MNFQMGNTYKLTYSKLNLQTNNPKSLNNYQHTGFYKIYTTFKTTCLNYQGKGVPQGKLCPLLFTIIMCTDDLANYVAH